MATVIYTDGRQESRQDFYELATGDWSIIDHVELKSYDRQLISTSPPSSGGRCASWPG
jgi:hypothetical protein